MSLYTVTTNGHIVETGIPVGCASHFGHWVNKGVLQTALDCGWQDEEAVQAMQEYEKRYLDLDWRFQDTFFDLVTEAEEWLNEHTEDGVWSWHEGDFRVDATEPCPHCGADRYLDRNIDPHSECPDHLGRF
jgi:hypothetical protein